MSSPDTHPQQEEQHGAISHILNQWRYEEFGKPREEGLQEIADLALVMRGAEEEQQPALREQFDNKLKKVDEITKQRTRFDLIVQAFLGQLHNELGLEQPSISWLEQFGEEREEETEEDRELSMHRSLREFADGMMKKQEATLILRPSREGHKHTAMPEGKKTKRNYIDRTKEASELYDALQNEEGSTFTTSALAAVIADVPEETKEYDLTRVRKQEKKLSDLAQKDGHELVVMRPTLQQKKAGVETEYVLVPAQEQVTLEAVDVKKNG